MRRRTTRTLMAVLAVGVVLSACSAASTGTSATRAATLARTSAAASHAAGHLQAAAAPKRIAAPKKIAAPKIVANPIVAKPIVRAVATTKPNHCARNTAPQKVIVSIAAQHLWFCARSRTIRDTAITSGMVGPDTSTPTGDYVIQGRDRDTVLTLNTGKQYDVRYWIPFDAPLFGFHDSSWQTFPYGSAKYRTQGSHGCVHMPLAAIAFLYRWAERPTAVHIS